MSEVLVAGVPSNLRLPEGAKASPVDSDLYNICERVKEIAPTIFIVAMDPPQPSRKFPGRFDNFVVMQHCEDGVERVIFRVEYLDARVVAQVAEIVHVPLEERIERIERESRALEQAKLDDALEESYEEIGGQMWHDLEKTGFIQRPVSYPKRNPTARRHRKVPR